MNFSEDFFNIKNVIAAQKINNLKPVILIACGNNFLGWVLTEFLLQQNCRVFYFGNFSPQEAKNISFNFNNPDFKFIYWNFESPLPSEIFQQNINYIFDLTETKKANFSLLSLAKYLKAKILITQKELADNYINEIFQNFSSVNFRLVYLPEIYGPRMPEEKFRFLKEKNFSLPCLYVTDAVFGLLKAMFLLTSRQKTFYLNPSGDEELKWKPQTSLEEGIRETEKYFSEKTKFFSDNQFNLKIFSEKFSERKIKRKKFKKLFKFIFLTLVIIFLLVNYYFVNLFLGVRYLRAGSKDFLNGEFEKAEINAKKARWFFENLKPHFKYLEYGQNLSLILERGSVLAEKTEELFSSLFNDSSKEISSLELKTELDSLYFDLSLFEKNLNEPQFKKLKRFLKNNNLVNNLNFLEPSKISEVKKGIIQTKLFLDVFDYLVGKEEKRTYLILFQNSAELRPTGGFIGSLAFLTFNKGKIIDFEVQDVYWADGQLKGHVEPPEEIKKYLGEANWYLRDVNWSPDFPSTAQKAEWFLEKETGRTVDGVIGVNLFFAQKLLEVVGEIEVPDFQEKINANNFFERAEYYSEVNFFPGSTQKKDFLGKVGRQLFEEIKNIKGKNKIKLGEVFYTSLLNKDVLVYFNNPQVMKIISDLNWDGKIREIKKSDCRYQPCFSDYLMIVEANLGVNKVNYFVEREVEHVAEIDEEGKIKKTLIINYQNKSPSEKFPGGRYKNYFRLLVPEGSVLDEVSFGNQIIKKEEVKETKEKGKTTFGFLIEILPGEKKELKISYFLPQRIIGKEKINWVFLVQKQSGIKPEKFNFKIKNSPYALVIPYFPTAVFDNGWYIFNPQFNQDLIFDIDLIKN